MRHHLQIILLALQSYASSPKYDSVSTVQKSVQSDLRLAQTFAEHTQSGLGTNSPNFLQKVPQPPQRNLQKLFIRSRNEEILILFFVVFID